MAIFSTKYKVVCRGRFFSAYTSTSIIFPENYEFNSTMLQERFQVRTFSAQFLRNTIVGSINSKTNKKGDTLAHMACLLGDVETLKFLRDKGSSVNSANNVGLKPCHFAFLSGSDDCIAVLNSTPGINILNGFNFYETLTFFANYGIAVDLPFIKQFARNLRKPQYRENYAIKDQQSVIGKALFTFPGLLQHLTIVDKFRNDKKIDYTRKQLLRAVLEFEVGALEQYQHSVIYHIGTPINDSRLVSKIRLGSFVFEVINKKWFIIFPFKLKTALMKRNPTQSLCSQNFSRKEVNNEDDVAILNDILLQNNLTLGDVITVIGGQVFAKLKKIANAMGAGVCDFTDTMDLSNYKKNKYIQTYFSKLLKKSEIKNNQTYVKILSDYFAKNTAIDLVTEFILVMRFYFSKIYPDSKPNMDSELTCKRFSIEQKSQKYMLLHAFFHIKELLPFMTYSRAIYACGGEGWGSFFNAIKILVRECAQCENAELRNEAFQYLGLSMIKSYDDKQDIFEFHDEVIMPGYLQQGIYEIESINLIYGNRKNFLDSFSNHFRQAFNIPAKAELKEENNSLFDNVYSFLGFKKEAKSSETAQSDTKNFTQN